MTAVGTSLATLPDPAEPTFVALGGAVGAFVGNTLARVRREPDERRTDASWDGGYWGTAIALGVYLIAILLEV